MTEDLQLLEIDKDVSRSCVFAFPDRPVETLPPNIPPGIPPLIYPYDPGDDWPFIPPSIRPIPGSDPHPGTIPPINPPTTFDQSTPFFYKGENEMPQYGGGSGIFVTEPPFVNIEFGPITSNLQILKADLNKRFEPRDIAGPDLLNESGHSTEEATQFNNITNKSGLYLIYVDKGGGQWLIYFIFFASYFNNDNDDHFVAFKGCQISGPSVLPNLVYSNTANVSIALGDYSAFGTPPAHNSITKNFQTACVYLGTPTTSANLVLE